MKRDYVFMTDSDSDLPYQYADEHRIPVVKMPYTLEGVEYYDDNGRAGTQKAFFDKMRSGAAPVTSLLPTAAYLEYFEPILKESDLLFLAFSSQMSSTYLNVLEAREQLLEKYPERKFLVVDTLSISYPMTLLIMGAHALYREGKSMEEVARWVEDNRCRAQVWITVDDLVYLRRGGRVSATSAVFGTMLNIKPLLTMSKAGKLEAYAKVQGSRKALKALVDKVAEQIEDPARQDVILLHADVEEQARLLKEMIVQRLPDLRGVDIHMIGPVVGAHAGPGTLGVCFMGKERPV